MNTSIDRIGREPLEPTVTEEDLPEYDEEDRNFNAMDYDSLVITEQKNLYGTDETVNGEVVEELTDEQVKGILSVSEEGKGLREVSPTVADKKFAAWGLPYIVTEEGSIQPREGQSTDAVTDYPPVDRID